MQENKQNVGNDDPSSQVLTMNQIINSTNNIHNGHDDVLNGIPNKKQCQHKRARKLEDFSCLIRSI